MLKYFKYDPRTHCEYTDIPASKPGGRPKKSTQNKKVNENDASQPEAKKSKCNVQGSFMEEEERAPKKQRPIQTSQVKSQLERFQEENETVPILIQQQKNKASFLAGFKAIFSSLMD